MYPIDNKINFRCVPQSGFAAGKGFRAELARDSAGAIDLDGVVKEAMDKGYFSWMNPTLVADSLKGVLQTMIDNTIKDGRTRKIDGYLETTLNLRGEFSDPSEDFDPARHRLAFSVKPLRAFRPNLSKIEPVNVNRVKAFRLSYLATADGEQKNHRVTLGQDFIIRGNSLKVQKNTHVSVNVYDMLTHMGLSLDTKVLSLTNTEIRCAWPEEVTAEHRHCIFTATVCQWDETPSDNYRSRWIEARINAN